MKTTMKQQEFLIGAGSLPLFDREQPEAEAARHNPRKADGIDWTSFIAKPESTRNTTRKHE